MSYLTINNNVSLVSFQIAPGTFIIASLVCFALFLAFAYIHILRSRIALFTHHPLKNNDSRQFPAAPLSDGSDYNEDSDIDIDNSRALVVASSALQRLPSQRDRDRHRDRGRDKDKEREIRRSSRRSRQLPPLPSTSNHDPEPPPQPSSTPRTSRPFRRFFAGLRDAYKPSSTVRVPLESLSIPVQPRDRQRGGGRGVERRRVQPARLEAPRKR